MVSLIAIILFSFALRVYQLDAFSFWTDEGLTPLRASYPISEILSNRITIQEGVTHDTHPPFYFLIIHVTRQLFGESDFAYRYPSLLAGVMLAPLLYQFGRRLHHSTLGLTAAFLAAINPLQIWYAREARMYTLFVLLMAAATYQLWRALQGRPLLRNLLLYLPWALLAVYTHYTAVFLLAVHALFWAWLLWQRGRRRLIIGLLALGLLAAIPIVPYTAPRLFTGAETNYFFVSPRVMLQDVVHFFNLGLTTQFSRVGIKLIDVAALLLLVVGFIAARRWAARSLLLSYLLATVFGLMVGSFIKPMYQGVRHIMVGSPAFLLLLGWGIVFFWEKRRQESYRWLWQTAVVAAVSVPLIGSIVSLTNLYGNHEQFAKDDFRKIVRYVEQRAGSNDLVLYNNAIQLSLHAHYQQREDLPVTALPVYPHQATGEEPQLSAYAQQYDRIWFVTEPPADHRDDGRLIQQWLERHLTVTDQRHIPAPNAVMETITYRTAPPIVAALPEDAHPVAAAWDDWPALRGWRPNFSQPAAQPTLWFDLFWYGPRPHPTADVVFRLLDSNGREWSRKAQSLSADADAPWPEDALARRSYHVRLPLGLPPGAYTLQVLPVKTPPAEPVTIGDIQVAPSTAWILLPDESFSPAQIHFDNGLTLAGVQTPVPTVRPGHTLPLSVFWRTETAVRLSHVRYKLDVIQPNGAVLRTQTDAPTPDWLSNWDPGALVRHNTGLYIAPDAKPGRYRLRWQMQEDESVVAARPFWRPWSTPSIIWGSIDVVPWPLQTTPPAQAIPLDAKVGEDIVLYGYNIQRPEADSLQLTLYWQARQQPDDDYLVFVHLVAPADETPVQQRDRIPVDGLRPTSGWRAHEVLTDRYQFDDLPPGEYEIRVGLFDFDTEQRLPIVFQGRQQPDHRLTLTTITVP